MAIFTTPRYEVAQGVAAIWGLQLGNTTMTDVLQIVSDNGGDFRTVIAGAFANSFGAASNASIAAAFVNNLGITGAPAAGAVEAVTAMLATSTNKSSTLLDVAKAFSNLDTTDPVVAPLVAAFNAKIGAAVAYSTTAGTADVAIGSLSSSTSFDLTNGRDVLTGTAGDDTFESDVIDNWNSFQSGDNINGGAGTDTLNATLGNSSDFAILARTSSVENIFIRSQSNNSTGNNGDNNPAADPVADGDNNDNTIDAELMRGVKQWWNTDSRADLVIEDVRINDDQITKDISIGWANADPSSVESSNEDKVDYEVYFSPESLRKVGDTTDTFIKIEVGNQLRAADYTAAGGKPTEFKDLPYTAVAFKVGTTTVTLQLPGLAGVNTAQDVVDVFQAAFAAEKLTNSALANVSIESATIDGFEFGTLDPFVTRNGPLIVLKAEKGTITPVAGTEPGWLVQGGAPSNNAFAAVIEPGTAKTTSDLITSTIILDNVGREEEAGDLVIGSMGTRTGVERFDITVANNKSGVVGSGTYTSSGSWVGHAGSTNNFLREVLVKNAADGVTPADYLYLGTNIDGSHNDLTTIQQTFLSTQSTQAGFAKYQAALDAALLNADGLTDVRLFDASKATGQIKVGATITADSIQKYQDLVDTDPKDGLDDVPFNYTLGTGNDSANIHLDERLWDQDGGGSSVIPGRHDFTFTVSGGDGNDHLNVSITGLGGGEDSFGGDANWYQNQKINKNITVTGGNGNDIISTPGSGDYKILGGTGDDTVYVDQSGWSDFDYNEGQEAWVFNAVNSDPFDLLSEPAASTKAVNAFLNVHFAGFDSKVEIGASNGVTSNVTITDLTINQAIKNAINNNAVLNKLLVAEDGPGRTLVIKSLIDGTEDDLSITFSNAALTPSQAAVGAAVTLFDPTSGGLSTLLDGYVHDGASHLWGGEDSSSTQDSRIEGGTGNDVIVLGTTGYHDATLSNTMFGSNDTLVYTGFANGTDSIVNFDTTYTLPGTPVTTLSNVAAVAERITVTFGPSDGTPVAETIIFDGSTVTLSAPANQGVIPAADVAFQFRQQFAGANWTISNAYANGATTVELTRNVAGVLTTDVVAADFTGTYFGTANGNGAVTVATTVQGVDLATIGSKSTFTVDFTTATTAAAAAGSFTFDGTTVPYAQGDGSITLAQKLAASSFANWTVARSGSNQVTFTAKLEGATAIGVAADFDTDGTNTINGTVAGTVGTANIGTPRSTTTASPGGIGEGFDFIDYSAYTPAGVMVNTVVLVDKGTDSITVGLDAPVNTTYSYVRMTEKTTNPGEYTIDLVTVDDKAATADTVQLIGVADFGETGFSTHATVHFVGENFII